MRTKTFAIILLLFSGAITLFAQDRIKSINITIEIPKVGASAKTKYL